MSTELIDLSQPQPTGFRPGFLTIPAALYHSIDAVSQSRLKLLAKSPAHLRWELDHPTPPTDAMKRGTLVHTAVLEPEAFYRCYCTVPDSLAEGITTADGKPAKSPKATTEYKQRLADFARANSGKEFVDAEDWDMAVAVGETLRLHRDAGVFISEAADTELTGLWRDEETGLLCKMRVDADCPDLDTIFDIKTTTDASRAAFERTIFNFRYYWQAAMYLEGMAALGKPRSTYAIIAVETEPPYGCMVYNLKSSVIDLARKEIRPLMRLYKACQQQNVWPSYPAGVQDIEIPAWAINQIERELV
jgi:hypothetical protein